VRIDWLIDCAVSAKKVKLANQKSDFIPLYFFDIHSQHKEPINSHLFYLENSPFGVVKIKRKIVYFLVLYLLKYVI